MVGAPAVCQRAHVAEVAGVQRYIEAYQAKKEAEAKLKAPVKPADGQDAAANGDQPTEDSLDDKVRPQTTVWDRKVTYGWSVTCCLPALEACVRGQARPSSGSAYSAG